MLFFVLVFLIVVFFIVVLVMWFVIGRGYIEVIYIFLVVWKEFVFVKEVEVNKFSIIFLIYDSIYILRYF